jgi:hypothetical protein
MTGRLHSRIPIDFSASGSAFFASPRSYFPSLLITGTHLPGLPYDRGDAKCAETDAEGRGEGS